ncbi:hypothetical protein CPLU01_14895 [Colletotrichum plurivorum]|uniref:Uncharacterized protein n=1 Tax=Colletotrichum plurivorum TaxID=2175906 RepID=A0A8H6JGV3_9PEZI|nr:hypothetical protein CPLU01_14895 [Colletotrichum plurivorum]
MQMNGPDGKWPEIEFSQAQLVMNRHFFGEHTGLPIESLHKTFEFERTIPPAGLAVPESHFPLENHPEMTHWKFSHDYSARIMNDELLVSRSHLVSASVCSLTEFLRVIDALELPVCGHIYAATRRPYLPFETFWVDKNGSIPELFEMWLESTQEAPGTKRVYTHGTLGDGACKTCFTDYLLKAEPGDRDGHWHLNLTTYHNLGSCQDPNDPKWHCLTMSSEAAFRRSKLKRRYSNGVGENVFFQWHGITNIQAKSNHQGEDGSDIEDDGDVEDGRVNEDRIKYQTEWARHRARFVEPFAVEVSQTMIGRGGLNYRHMYAVEIAQSLASGNIA